MLGAGNQILCDGVYWYEYDKEGHRTEKYQWLDEDQDGEVDKKERFDLTCYTWDIRGRLVKIVTKPDGRTKTRVVKYECDYQNRRVEKNEEFDDDGQKAKAVERFLYNGQDIVLQTDKKGNPTHRLLHGPLVLVGWSSRGSPLQNAARRDMLRHSRASWRGGFWNCLSFAPPPSSKSKRLHRARITPLP